MRLTVRRVIGITAAVLVTSAVGLGVLVYVVVSDMCANETLAEFASPDGTRKLVMYERDCGATTRGSIHVSLLEVRAKLKNDPGNIFVSYKGLPLQVRWDGPRRVLVQHDASVQVFKKESRQGDVEIQYAALK
jgi:Family of unknown function (DUF5412)